MRIWTFTDDKPGHLNQLRGLVEALARRLPVTSREISVSHCSAARLLLATRYQLKNRLPHGRPDLILCAGSSTHWPALVARWRLGGKLCVLMRPSWPLRMFDFAIVPKHDGLQDSERVFTTVGAINRMRPGSKRSGSRMVLLGGPSKHFDWSSAALVEQANRLREKQGRGQWVVADSRRTPAGIAEKIAKILEGQWVHHQDVDSSWLPSRMAETEQVWVTPDSVSMVYEALTAGCRVSLFELPSKRTRVAKGITQLLEEGRVGRLTEPNAALPEAPPLAEADRAAAWLLERLNSGQR